MVRAHVSSSGRSSCAVGFRALGLLRRAADRKRSSRAPPRLGPGLQGPVLPLPDHARLRGPPQGRMGHPRTAGRGRGRETARDHRQAPDRGDSRDRRVHPPLPRVGAQLRRRLADLTERIGYWIDFDDAYWTFSSDYVQSVWSEPEEPLGPGSPLRGHQGGALLSAMWHRTLQPRARPARRLPRRRGRVGLRAASVARRREGGRTPAQGGSVETRSKGSRSSPGRRRRGPSSPTPGPRSAPVSSTWWSATSSSPPSWSPRGPRRRRGGLRDRARERPGRAPLRAALRRSRAERRARPTDGGWCPASSSRPTRGPASCTWRRPSARSTARRAASTGSRPSTRSVPTAASPPRCPGSPESRSARRTSAVNRRLEELGPAAPTREPYVHPYPHCWRCGTALDLLGQAELVRPHVRAQGRPRRARTAPSAGTPSTSATGGWGSGSPTTWTGRSRATASGAPRCRCGAATRATSAASVRSRELSAIAGRDVTGVDPHRPTIDEVTFRLSRVRRGRGCRRRRHAMRRVEPVIDAWFDSGSMPSAQWGYPLSEGSADRFVFPADFICEAIDQTRGWFYSLLAVNTLVRGATPVPQRALPRPHRRRRGAQDVEEHRQRHRPLGDPHHPRCRPAALVDVLAGIALDADPGELRGHRRSPARGAASPSGTPGRSSRPMPRSTTSTPTTRRFRRLPSAPLLDRWMRSRLHAHRRRRSPTRSTTTSPSRPRPRSPSWSTTSPTGTCVAAVAASGGPTPTPNPADALGAQATLHEVLVMVARPACTVLPVPRRPHVARPDRRARVRLGPPCRLAGVPNRTHATPTSRTGMALARRLASLGRAARARRRASKCANRWLALSSTFHPVARRHRPAWSRTSSTST